MGNFERHLDIMNGFIKDRTITKNRMPTTEEKIKIMQAWLNGEEVAFSRKEDEEQWIILSEAEPEWNWTDNEYRIVDKKPCYLTELEMMSMVGKVIIGKETGIMFLVICCSKFAAYIIGGDGNKSHGLSAKDLYEHYLYADGSKIESKSGVDLYDSSFINYCSENKHKLI